MLVAVSGTEPSFGNLVLKRCSSLQAGLTHNDIREVAGADYSPKAKAKLNELCITELEAEVLKKQMTIFDLVMVFLFSSVPL